MSREELLDTICEMSGRTKKEIVEYFIECGCQALRPAALHYKVCKSLVDMKDSIGQDGPENIIGYSEEALKIFEKFGSEEYKMTKGDLESIFNMNLEGDNGNVDDFLKGMFDDDEEEYRP